MSETTGTEQCPDVNSTGVRCTSKARHRGRHRYGPAGRARVRKAAPPRPVASWPERKPSVYTATTAPPPRDRRVETAAIGTILEALLALEADSQARVMRVVYAYLSEDDISHVNGAAHDEADAAAA